MDEFLIAKLICFAMVLTRISAFFIILPIFSWQTIPPRIKISIVILLSFFFTTSNSFPDFPKGMPFLYIIILMANEAVYGIGMGLIIAILFNVIKFAGHIIEREMGLNMASVLDPMTGEEGQPLGNLLEILFVLIFLSVNGHHLFIMIISRSFETFAIGDFSTAQVLTQSIIKAGSVLFIASLRLAAPILVCFILLLVSLAVLARISPEMDIFFISLSLKVGLGLLIVSAMLPFISGYIDEFTEWIYQIMPM